MTRRYKKACGDFEIDVFYTGAPDFINLYYRGEQICSGSEGHPVRPSISSLNDLIYLIESLKREAQE